MRSLGLASGFFIGVATVANACPLALCAAPAPAIGAGVPVAFAAGVVLCGAIFIKRWRRS